ncbi:MAG: DUF4190 domain-containing protein [Pseudomonadota bacterium]
MNPPPPGPGRPNPFEPPPAGSYGVPVPSYSAAPPASSEAIAAIVCGALAWTCFPLGFVAIWLGARARRAARENPERVGGQQLALAGMIVGGVFGILWLLFWLSYLAFFVFAIGFGAFHK